MTAIGAFMLNEHALLLTDMMLTAPNHPSREAPFNPMHRPASEALHREMGRSVVGGRRKATIVSPNLALAWTGHELAAHDVVARLVESFGGKHVTAIDLEAFLRTIVDYEQHLELHLIGWVCDPNPRCFRWNSGWPSVLYFAQEHFGGSGEEVLRWAIDPIRRSNIDDKIEIATLRLMGACLVGETGSGRFTLSSSGIWFEGLYYTADRGFSRVNDVAFAYIRIERRGSEIHVFPPDYQIRYEARPDYSLVDLLIKDSSPTKWSRYIQICSDVFRSGFKIGHGISEEEVWITKNPSNMIYHFYITDGEGWSVDGSLATGTSHPLISCHDWRKKDFSIDPAGIYRWFCGPDGRLGRRGS